MVLLDGERKRMSQNSIERAYPSIFFQNAESHFFYNILNPLEQILCRVI